MMLPCEQTKAKYMSNYCTCCQKHEDVDYNKFVPLLCGSRANLQSYSCKCCALIESHTTSCTLCYYPLCLSLLLLLSISMTSIYKYLFIVNYHFAFCAHAGVPLPVIENITAGTRCINFTWYHNKTCCTNSKYTVSWQQWQSEKASAHANKNGSRMVNPADHHLSIKPLNPGTMYIVTVSVECQSGELQNATVSINTTASKSTYVCMHRSTCIRI